MITKSHLSKLSKIFEYSPGPKSCFTGLSCDVAVCVGVGELGVDALQAFAVVVEAAGRAALPGELQRADESLAGQTNDGHFDLRKKE